MAEEGIEEAATRGKDIQPQDTNEGAPTDHPAVVEQAPEGISSLRWLLDDFVLIGFASGSLISAVVLQTAYPQTPPTLVSILLGIAVAAITYRYLGGIHSAEFSLAFLKLSGSAALLAGITYFVGQELERQSNLIKTRDQYQSVIDERDATIEDLETRIFENNREVVDRVALLDPDDPFVLDLRRSLNNVDGPGAKLARMQTLEVSNNGSVRRARSFQICADKWNEFYPFPATRGSTLRFEISNPSSGDVEHVDLAYDGTITDDACPSTNRTADIRLSCDASAIVFPNAVLGCNGRQPRFANDAVSIQSTRVGVPIEQ